MKLSEKLRYLREMEGTLRGMDRAMSQQELMRAIAAETGEKVSQSYLSQIESGARPHLTNTSRLLLARFFKVHPGYLVDDPEGYNVELLSDARALEDKFDLWLVSGAERFRRDPEVRQALLTVARHDDSRKCILLLEAILEAPELAGRLMDALRPAAQPMPAFALSSPQKNMSSGAQRSVTKRIAQSAKKKSAAKKGTKSATAKRSV